MSIEMNGAQFIVKFLLMHGIKRIYGFPGGAIMPIMAAVREQPDIDWITARHEMNSGFMASAESKVTGQLACCMATSGPGATNLLTGVLDAHSDRYPLLAITGQGASTGQNRYAFQDINQTYLYKEATGLSFECKSILQLPALLNLCIGFALKRQQAVQLAIPVNIQTESFPDDFDTDIAFQLTKRVVLLSAPEEAYDIVAKTISQYKRIAIAVGPRAYGCGKQIEMLAAKLACPIFTSLSGKGVINEDHPNSFGVIGIFGEPGFALNREILYQSDLILAFGVDYLLPFLTTNNLTQDMDLIQIEPDMAFDNFQFGNKRSLFGAMDYAAEALSQRIKQRVMDKAISQIIQKHKKLVNDNHAIQGSGIEKYANPAVFFSALSQYLNENSILCLDTGENTIWAASFLKIKKYSRLLSSNRQGAMGFSLNAAIAAKLNFPEKVVFAITGDGGLQMVLAELCTAKQLKLGIIVVVLRNGGLNLISAHQSVDYGTRLLNPDFCLLSESIGLEYHKITRAMDLDQLFQKIIKTKDVPCLLEVPCDPAEHPPRSLYRDFLY